MKEPEPANLAQALGSLKPKDKQPGSARILNTWIAQAQDRLGAAGPRLGWLVAATVVCAALQRVVDQAGSPLFLVKGGTMLQYRLTGMSRTTQDVDGLVRADIDDFVEQLDASLEQQWGPLTLVRGEVEAIEVPYRLSQPRRFDVTVLLNGVTWPRIQVEISPDEGEAGTRSEQIAAPVLAGFGLPTPDGLSCLSMRYQIAQKVHAASDPHSPPDLVNDRPRDVVDLLLLRDLITSSGHPALHEVHMAIQDVFQARAAQAQAVGVAPRLWPAEITAHQHWGPSFVKLPNPPVWPWD